MKKLQTKLVVNFLPLMGFPLVAAVIAAILLSKEGTALEESREAIFRLATTTSTVNSGLLDVLLPVFEKEYHIRTEISSVGSGAALDLARKGQADAILSHARPLEDQFIFEGYGINDVEVMYDDFVIVGPLDDPAKLNGEPNVKVALQKIHSSKSLFISRGDNSGTHVREMELWRLAGIEPKGKWYKESRADMLKTLQIASREKRYSLSDRGTFLSHKSELLLRILVEGDRRLFNSYRVIAVNPAKVPGVNYKAAMAFIDFLKSKETQTIIEDYGIKEYGQPLFHPLVKKGLP